MIKSFGRAAKRCMWFMSAAANTRDAICLALFSNHRTFSLAKTLGKNGVILKMTGKNPVYLDFGSRDHRMIFIEIFLTQVYDLGSVSFLPEVVIDCGAHIGLFSRIASEKFPDAKLYSFEPNRKNFKWLERQFDRHHENTKLLNLGVGVAAGVGFVSGDGCQSIVSLKKEDEATRVELIDFGKWIRDTVTSNKLLLKIDIEGGEFELIPHILEFLPQKTIILFETHGFADDNHELLERLNECHFTVTEIRNRVDDGICFGDFIAIRD